ncbi:hypothetical protein ACIGCZ_02315 [Streptomyces nigra]|uniref:hypothetical protein n=1 Tax=Streptomyces nigra TaxID=1827580 RepID=UPI0037D2DC4B
MRKLRSALASSAVAALSVSGLMVAEGTAHAVESKCTDPQTRAFPTSGLNTDVRLQVCILESPSSPASTDYRTYTAVVTGSFTDGGAGSRKFDNFDLEIRLEHRPLGSTTDSVFKKAVCDRTADVNRLGGGTLRCEAALEMHVNNRRNVSGDATVHYDLDADGKGPLEPWGLTGSPHFS